MIKTTLRISDMHCKSCEVLLEASLKKIEGVKKVHSSHKTGILFLQTEGPPPMNEITEVIQKCGYSLSDDLPAKGKSHKNSTDDLIEIALIALMVGVGVFVLKELEFTKYLPDVSGKVNPAIAFVLGIVASLSTCLVLVGGLVMSFGETVHIDESKRHPLLAKAIPHLYFHAGRIGGFVILGALLGLIGSRIEYSLGFTGFLTILVAIVMLYIGLQILNLVPNITRFGFHLPKALSSKIHSLEDSRHHFAPLILGALTFLLPCGFTQSMQLAAVASGNPVTGGLLMGAFALGTLPTLISLGIGSSVARSRRFGIVNRFVGVIIVFFAIFSLNSGLVIAGSPITLESLMGGTGKNTSTSVQSGKIQTLKMKVDWVFEPNEFRIKKGIPVRWEIEGVNISSCSNQIIVPSMGIRKKIEPGMNIVEFTPEKTGTIPFSCWMGMIRGTFIVEP